MAEAEAEAVAEAEGRFSSWAKKKTISRLRVGSSPLASSPRLLASSLRLLGFSRKEGNRKGKREGRMDGNRERNGEGAGFWAKKKTIFRLRVGSSPLASSPRLLASS